MKRAIPMAAAVTLLMLAAWGPGEAGAQGGDDARQIDFGLSVQIARWEGEPVVDGAWIDERVAWSNRIFEPAGVAFTVREVGALATEHARLETRRDRHRLGGLVSDERIDVFVVERLRDVDDPSRFRQGVHWRSRLHPGAHYVVVADHAAPTTLAHELGHFFGNRRHSDVPGNVMSYERGDGPPFFDERQVRRIRHFARRYLRTGELAPAGDDG